MPKPEMRVCKKCGRNRNASFYVGKRGRTCTTCRRGTRRSGSRDVHLRETYGITGEESARLLAASGNRCRICGGTRPYYDQDHSHREEKRLIALGFSPLEARRFSCRFPLCRRCNRRLLPSCLEDTAILRAAINYVTFALAEAQAILSDSPPTV